MTSWISRPARPSEISQYQTLTRDHGFAHGSKPTQKDTLILDINCVGINPKQLQKFVTETEGNIKLAYSPKEVAQQEHVLHVFTNPTDGLASIGGRYASKAVINCSTVETAQCLKVSEAVAPSGLGQFTDSLVSSEPDSASKASLAFILRGSDDAVRKVIPIVQTIVKESCIFRYGIIGARLATKQINNYLTAIGVGEAMNIAVCYGLDPKVPASVISISTDQCYNKLYQNPVQGVTPTATSSCDFEGSFSIELCVGILKVAVALGKQVGAKNVLSNVLLDSFHTAMQDDICKGEVLSKRV